MPPQLRKSYAHGLGRARIGLDLHHPVLGEAEVRQISFQRLQNVPKLPEQEVWRNWRAFVALEVSVLGAEVHSGIDSRFRSSREKTG